MDRLNYFKLYIDTLHSEDQKGGVFVVAPQRYIYKSKTKSLKHIYPYIKEFFENGDNSVFVTLNTYKKISRNNIRHEDNLWGLDTVMVDIDAAPSLLGNEQNAYNVLSWYWNKKQALPKPNLCSFTGSGGMHLYYTFNRVPALAKGSVSKFKQLINNAVKNIIDTDEYFKMINSGFEQGCGYHVDTKVTDNQRFDRVPGSINPKTNVVCRCFKVDTESKRYELRDLINFLQKSYHEFENRYDSVDSNKIIKMSKGLSENKLLMRLNKKRVNGLFELQKNGKTFIGCREYSIFILSNSLRQMGYREADIEKIIFKFNNGFSEPLKECEVRGNLGKNQIYKFSNKKIASMLNLTDDEKQVMFSKTRPGNRKERTKQNKINIAKLVVQGKTISAIAKTLNISESIVKHMRVAIKKDKGFFFWAAGCSVKAYKKLINEFIKAIKGQKNKYLSFFEIKGSFCNILNILPSGIEKLVRYFSLSDHIKIITENSDKKIDFRCTKGVLCS